MNRSIKKLGEIESVKSYLLNEGILAFDERKVNTSPDEPVDVEYDQMKYQIVSADFEFRKLMGTTPKDENGVKFIEGRVRGPNEIWNDFVIAPLKKKGKYGKSANGIILLISCHIEPPWVEKQIKLAKTMESNMLELKKLLFEEIYLVFPKRNLKLFP